MEAAAILLMLASSAVEKGVEESRLAHNAAVQQHFPDQYIHKENLEKV